MYSFIKNILLLTALLSLIPAKGQIPLYPDSGGIRISRLGINTGDAEFSPVLFNDQLYFVSDRPYHFGVVNFREAENRQLSDIYSSIKKDSTCFLKPENLLHPVNSVLNEGPFSFTQKGIYITTNNSLWRESGSDRHPLQISFSDLNSDGKFAKPKRIPFDLHDSVSVGHPFVSGDTLMFLVSDMAGGIGGTDLYYSRYINGNWSRPVNCGEKINTPYREEFPFFCEGKLYFSSDRPGGAGKLDIYAADRPGEEFLFPARLSSPINGPADDFGLFLLADKRTGYFSSNRKGSDDVFYFSVDLAMNFSNCSEQKFNEYCYTFYEESAKTDTDTAGLFYEWIFGDGAKARGPEVYHCYEGEGEFLVELNVVDKSSGEVFFNQLSYEFEIKNHEQLYIGIPDSVVSGHEIAFDPTYSNIKGYTIHSFSWDFGDRKYSFELKPRHRYKDPGEYEVNLKTSGSFEGLTREECISRKILVLPVTYNGKPASTRRVPLTWSKDYHFKKKLLDSLFQAEPEILKFIRQKLQESEKKKRENQLLRGNESVRLKTDSAGEIGFSTRKEGQAKVDYRVHFGASETYISPDDPLFAGLDSVTVVRTLKLYQYFAGKFHSPSRALTTVKTLKEMGFNPFVFPFENDSLQYSNNPEVNKKLFADTISRNGIQEQSVVYFGFNDFKLSGDARTALASLASKYCKTKSEFLLSGYTDSKGSSEYNLKLCRKRLNEVKEVLISHGVKETLIRINPIGPVQNQAGEDTEIARQHNRRVEVAVNIK